MLRSFANSLRENCIKISTRYMCDRTKILIGGGLEKPQGGLKEEQYFYEKSQNLMAKIREEGANLKSENYWHQFDNVSETRGNRSALRETYSLNKQKNCLEEAFFLNEQSDCYRKLCKKKITIVRTKTSEGIAFKSKVK